MPDTLTDHALIADAWRTYDETFAEHVGDIVTPDAFLEDEAERVEAARTFMFAFALGTIAGADAVAPDAVDSRSDLDRVEAIVDTVVEINDDEAIPVSAESVATDFVS